tara:strand:+ start:344 stop:559 length:216 start_codon:yes stop_codon:yes gene_type:complete
MNNTTKKLMTDIEHEIHSIRYTLDNIKNNGLPHKKTFQILFNTLIKKNKDLQDMIVKHHKYLLLIDNNKEQ